MSDDSMSRRDFVGAAAAAGAFTIVPRHVLGGVGYRAPSDTLNVACIGVGGMGYNDVRGMSVENIYALCDVDAKSAERSFRNFPRARRYTDYREMFDKEARNIDAVTVTIPDHSHAAAAMMAMKLGKPTYCQKPLARTLGEVRALEDAARQLKVPTQMGNQGHSHEGTRLIREWVEGGLIGTVKEVHFWTNRPIWPQAIDRPLQEYYIPSTMQWDLWLGPAPERPYNPAYAPFRWRGWWDFGTGALGDMACHLMDAAFWTLDLRNPSRIIPDVTQLYPETAPSASRIEYHFPARNGRGDITVVWRDGSLFPPRPPEVPADQPWPFDPEGGQLWVGTEGKLTAGTYGDDPRLLDPARQAEVTAHPLPVKYPRTGGVYAEFIAAAKGGPPAGSTFDGHAGPLTEMVLLGDLAVRTGRTIELDGNGKVTTDGIPAEYTQPAYRKGWSL